MRKFILLFIALSLWACNSTPEIEKVKNEIFKKPTAEDIAAENRQLANTTMPDIAAVKNPDDIKIVTGKELDGHPLAGLDKPEDEKIIKYLKIQTMEWTCWSDRKDRLEDCEKLITEAIKKCADAGMSTTRADFKNRAFIERQMRVLEKQKAVKSTMHGPKSTKYFLQCSDRLEKFKKGELL